MRLTPDQSGYFDSWRGASAFVVLIAHAAQIFDQKPHPLFGAFAAAAVMAFFALSGFFIGKSLQANDWKRFVIARGDRLLPPFLLCLALTLVLYLVAPLVFVNNTRYFPVETARDSFSIDGFWPTSFFLNGFAGQTLSSNGPLWSLSFEVWYYAIAALFAFGHRLSAIFILIVLTILNKEFAILGGVWAGGFWLSQKHTNGTISAPRFPVWLAPLALLVLVTLVPLKAAGYATLAFELAFGAWFVHHMAGVLLTTPTMPPLLPGSAAFSYTLYVVHFPIMLFAYGAGAGIFTAMLIAVGFAIVVGIPIERWRPLRSIAIVGSKVEQG